MRHKTFHYIFLGIVILGACKEEKKTGKTPQPTPYNYNYANNSYDQNYQQNYNNSAAIYGTGTLRIEVSPMTSGTLLQGITNQTSTWTFRAISGTTGGSAVIFKIEADGQMPTTMTITETDTDTATVTWRPARGENKTGTLRITARDVGACNGVNTTGTVNQPAATNANCTNYSTSTSNDLVSTYTYQNGSSSVGQSGIAGPLVAGLLLGGLTGLLANGDVGMGMSQGLQTSLLLAAATQGQTGQFGVPYGYVQNPYGSQYPYGQNGWPNTYIPGGFNVNTMGQQSCYNIFNQQECSYRSPACVWSFGRCTDARSSQFGGGNCNGITNSAICNQQTNCTWTGDNFSGNCRNY